MTELVALSSSVARNSGCGCGPAELYFSGDFDVLSEIQEACLVSTKPESQTKYLLHPVDHCHAHCIFVMNQSGLDVAQARATNTYRSSATKAALVSSNGTSLTSFEFPDSSSITLVDLASYKMPGKGGRH